MVRRTYKPTDNQKEGQADKQTKRHTNRLTDGQTDSCIGGLAVTPLILSYPPCVRCSLASHPSTRLGRLVHTQVSQAFLPVSNSFWFSISSALSRSPRRFCPCARSTSPATPPSSSSTATRRTSPASSRCTGHYQLPKIVI